MEYEHKHVMCIMHKHELEPILLQCQLPSNTHSHTHGVKHTPNPFRDYYDVDYIATLTQVAERKKKEKSVPSHLPVSSSNSNSCQLHKTEVMTSISSTVRRCIALIIHSHRSLLEIL